VDLDRYWLLTWTTYGTWLPGDPRGFVSDIRDSQGRSVRHNVPGTPFDADMPALEGAARRAMVGQSVWLGSAEAEILCKQFQETAIFRGWTLFAVAIMRNHVHVVLGVPGDPEPERLLQDFKSYGSRALGKQGCKPAGARWWTRSGSKRKLPCYEAVCAASDCVTRQQAEPLVVWSACDPRL
jgi:hypothetical protein